MSKTQPKLFESFAFAKGLTLRNRIVMAPMTTWSGNADGTISDEELAYYRRRGMGVGLVITGCTHVMPNGIGFSGEFAAYDDSFTPSLRRLAEAAKSGGAPAILQIFHAGNKAVPELVPNSDVVGASVVAGVDYMHVSLSSVLQATPIDNADDRRTAALIVERVAGGVPVVAAGQIRRLEQAESALELGLSLVAVGQGLVMNPDWVELALSDRGDQIDTALRTSGIPEIVLPAKLWKVIEATTGWFDIKP